MARPISEQKIRLSPLMVQLLVGCANGKQLKEIAKERYISYSTATNSVATAKERLSANSISHAVVLAMGVGYLSHPTGPDLQVMAL